MSNFEWSGRNACVGCEDGKIGVGVFLPFGNGEYVSITKAEALEMIKALTHAVIESESGAEQCEEDMQNALATGLRDAFTRHPGNTDADRIMAEFNKAIGQIFTEYRK